MIKSTLPNSLLLCLCVLMNPVAIAQPGPVTELIVRDSGVLVKPMVYFVPVNDSVHRVIKLPSGFIQSKTASSGYLYSSPVNDICFEIDVPVNFTEYSTTWGDDQLLISIEPEANDQPAFIVISKAFGKKFQSLPSTDQPTQIKATAYAYAFTRYLCDDINISFYTNDAGLQQKLLTAINSCVLK